MQGDTSLLVDATRQASKFLHRDYFELENLQASSKAIGSFCEKSYSRAIESLQTALGKYYKTVIFDNEEVKNLKFHGKAALVEPLDGIKNLERSLPFFAIMVTIISSKNNELIPEKCILNFPALNEIYYAEKGRGAWLEKHSPHLSGGIRVRVSGTGSIEDSVVATNYDHLKLAKKISTNIRIFDSYVYSVALLASGKIDACIFEKRDISALGLNLFITEAGGRSFVNDKVFVGTNYQIYDKVKQIYQEK